MENNDGYKICENMPMTTDKKTDTKLSNTDGLDDLKGNYNHLTDAEKQTNSNQQNICNNQKNRNSKINKSDHNVVIDDAKQSQQQQQPQQAQTNSYGCVHYKRQAKFVVSLNK